MRYLKLYFLYCGIAYLMNIATSLFTGVELINGTWFKILFPLLLVGISFLLDKQEESRANAEDAGLK